MLHLKTQKLLVSSKIEFSFYVVKFFLARHREKPTYYTIGAAIESLENFAKLNCDLRAYGIFETKYIRFKDNFLAYRISG